MPVENLTCPKCGGRMVSRATKRNLHDMAPPRRFWGCANFPTCNGTRNTDGEVPTRQNSQRVSDHDFEGSDGGDLPSDRARKNDRRRWD